MLKSNRSDTIILSIILIVGIILRFYKFPHIPFTHDELSALSRLNFTSFHDLIEEGVKLDGHPAGVQVFLFYWVKLTGGADGWIKIPFLLFGVGSILLSYLIAKKWFNSTVGLLVAANIASLQFPIMYSQIARPYISGMFFCLLMVFFWTRLITNNQNKKLFSYLAYIISAAICCYNHHFSLMFVGIVYLTGVFIIKKEVRIYYISTALGIGLLYLPHLNILLYQFSVGGLDWLGKPRSSFIIDHIKYIFHFDSLVYASTALLIFTGIYTNKLSSYRLNRFQIISLSWFLLPILTAYFYSVYFKPVAQHSVLIFSFSFLLIFIFSFFKSLSTIWKTCLVSTILLINVFSLIYNREYYEIFYKQPFNEFSLQTKVFLKEHDQKDVLIMLSENAKYLNHYFLKMNPGVTYASTPDLPLEELRKEMRKSESSYIIIGNLPLEYVQVVKEYYPSLVFKDFGFTYEYYIFSKKPDLTNKVMSDTLFSTKNSFSQDIQSWYFQGKRQADDANHRTVCYMDSTAEWGPVYEATLNDISHSRHNFIDVAIDYKCSSTNAGLLVLEISKGDSAIYWQSMPVQNFYDSVKKNEWQSGYLSLRLTNLFKHNSEMEDCKLKIFYWNNSKVNILLDDFTINIREGNERVYSLVEDKD